MIADDLKARRKAAGLTQFELASKIGITQGAVAHIEGGFRRPSIEVLTAWVRETGGGSVDLGAASTTPDPKAGVGARLRAVRVGAALTQAALAEILGVTQTTISKIESANRGIDVPEYEAWIAACAASGGTPSPKPHAVHTHPIAADLRAMRTARGLTQEQVAKLLDIPASTLAARENGQDEPAWADLQKWAGALGMELIHGFRPVSR